MLSIAKLVIAIAFTCALVILQHCDERGLLTPRVSTVVAAVSTCLQIVGLITVMLIVLR